MSYQHIEIKPIASACGAEILGIDLSQDLDSQRLSEIKRAFHENLVIFFRDQKITEDQHKAFGQKFGTLNIHPRYEPLEGYPEIIPIRKDPEHTENIGNVWHQDLTHLEKPPLGSILYALEVPPTGGDTMFANQYLAYETLSEGMKELLEGLVALHANGRILRTLAEGQAPTPGTEGASAGWSEMWAEHPVVRTHPIRVFRQAARARAAGSHSRTLRTRTQRTRCRRRRSQRRTSR